MALLQVEFFSQALGMASSMNVLLPQPRAVPSDLATVKKQGPWPTLYLLHGYSDNHTAWQRYTSIERYVTDLELAVVMPAANLSYYTNTNYGHRYWDFIAYELPALCQSFFQLSSEREDNFVCGLSMGGYGAFKLALTHPEKFSRAASLSGALDLQDIFTNIPNREWEDIFGQLDKFQAKGHDLFALADQLVQTKSPRPQLFQCCGTEDFLYNANQNFLQHCKDIGLDICYEEGVGEHNWAYWDKQIQAVLKWLTKDCSK